MNIKSKLAFPFAQFISKKIKKEMMQALTHQEQTLQMLLSKAQKTVFGKDHHFDQIHTPQEFREAVPVRDYEQIKSYIEEVKSGKENILWKGKPVYFAKTSGTTSGAKYIPISNVSIPFHIQAARNALLCYIAETGNADFVNGQMIFLSGSPELERNNGILTGRLSGIVNHHVPPYLRRNQMPSYATNCIEDWETKLDAIVEETIAQDMTLISGIPPWMQMYLDKLQEKSGKKTADLFKNLSLIVHGGVNFEPYHAKLMDTIGKKIDTIETFPASEGFFAFQDTQTEEGLLLNTNAGMYFEFIPLDEMEKVSPTRLTLADVKIGINYALIVSTNAGLWAYNIGDTIKFVSLHPFRILVTGRIKHFISAFGEHVIAEEVEHAMRATCEKMNVKIIEFTVAPFVAADQGKSYHEWFIEFEQTPTDVHAFAQELDHQLRLKNTYYDDLISGGILSILQIRPLQKNAFIQYMKSIGKLGGQNKTARLSNNRVIAEGLRGYVLYVKA